MLPPSWASFHPMHAQSMSRGSNSWIEAPSSQICQVDKQECHHSQLRGKTSIHFSLTDVRESHSQAYAQQSPSISGTVHKFSTANFLPSSSLFNSVIFIYLINCNLKLHLLLENSMHAYNIFWSYPPSSLTLNSLILLHPHPSKLHSFLYIYSSERLTCTAHLLFLDLTIHCSMSNLPRKFSSCQHLSTAKLFVPREKALWALLPSMLDSWLAWHCIGNCSDNCRG